MDKGTGYKNCRNLTMMTKHPIIGITMFHVQYWTIKHSERLGTYEKEQSDVHVILVWEIVPIARDGYAGFKLTPSAKRQIIWIYPYVENNSYMTG